MELTKQLANSILESMFEDYSFDFDITEIDDESFDFKIGNENNIIHLCFDEKEDSGLVEITVLSRSESYKQLGEYNNETGEFESEYDFWETMFIEILQD